jgi:hypothetical protein
VNGKKLLANAGDGIATATWTFTGLTPGQYRVPTTWCANALRASNAPFTIDDGNMAPVRAPGASNTFTVQLDATTVGMKGGQMSFVTDDGDENPFNFSISGEVTTATQVFNLGPIGFGIDVLDTASGLGYIMYSQEDVFTRFAANPPNNGISRHAIAVRDNDGVWEYNDRQVWRPFTPVTNDRLLAEVDFSADTITGLTGTFSPVNGIERGYTSGDLTFFANQFNGNFNLGEFTVTGTSFQVSAPGP